MADSADPKYLDKRTVDRYMRAGQLEEAAYERHIQGLPDVAEKAVPVETLMLDDADDFDDEDDDIDDEDTSEDSDASDTADEAPVDADDTAATTDDSASNDEGPVSA